MLPVSGDPSPVPPAFLPSPAKLRQRTVRPIGAYQLQGLACVTREQLQTGFPQTHFDLSSAHLLIGLDAIRGHLLQIDPTSDRTAILNPYHAAEFRDASGLWMEPAADRLWFCYEDGVYVCNLPDLSPHRWMTLPYPAQGVALQGDRVYVSCQKSGYIHLYDRPSGKLQAKLPLPGVGLANLGLRQTQLQLELWLCDRIEQSVYCLDAVTGEQRYRILTPHSSPTALAFYPDPQTGEAILYIAYAGDEPYIRDNPNHPDNPLEISFRDHTFVQPLHFTHRAAEHYTLSNGYLLEMAYIEELAPLEDVDLGQLQQLEWRIALPANTPRQQLNQVEAIGLPFREEIQEGQRVAVFQLTDIRPQEARLFGWKAQLEVRGIKYLLTPEDVEACPGLSPEFQARYLVDNDELAMDSEIVRRAAKEAIGSETNLLRQMLKNSQLCLRSPVLSNAAPD